MAKIVVAKNEGLEVCGTCKCHEGAVVDGCGSPTCAEALDIDRAEALLILCANDCEETMKGVGVGEDKVVPVQDIDRLVVDLFADGEKVWD
jgi:hypothetical protein